MSNDSKDDLSQMNPNFERWMRQLLAGIKSVRRWQLPWIFVMYDSRRNRYNKIRFYLARMINVFVRLFTFLYRKVDPWRTAPENVLEHTFKQMMIVQKMLAIESHYGNPNHLDYYLLLQGALNHDLAESQTGDINYHEKSQNKEALDKKEKEVFTSIIADGVYQDYTKFFVFPDDFSVMGKTAEKEFWYVSEHIGYCYYMFYEINWGDLPDLEKIQFALDLSAIHLPILEQYEKKFPSVAEILNIEFVPKMKLTIEMIKRRRLTK